MGDPTTTEFPPERIAKCIEGLYALCVERSRTGTEIVFRRCDVCGSEERLNEYGRLVWEHHYTAHHPAPAPSVEIDLPSRAGEYDRGTPSRAMIDREAARTRTKARAEQFEH